MVTSSIFYFVPQQVFFVIYIFSAFNLLKTGEYNFLFYSVQKTSGRQYFSFGQPMVLSNSKLGSPNGYSFFKFSRSLAKQLKIRSRCRVVLKRREQTRLVNSYYKNSKQLVKYRSFKLIQGDCDNVNVYMSRSQCDDHAKDSLSHCSFLE